MTSDNYLTVRQVEELLGGINGNRVGRDGKGHSHVEAYEIRAHLTRIFGFGRWSADLTDHRMIYDIEGVGQKRDNKGEPVGDPFPVWTVCYVATVRLTVCSPNGTVLCTYTEAATGEAKNQPHRGDAHDLAVKTAESQAFKRCAVNLGDAFGLSLYRKGSLGALVRGTLVMPAGAATVRAPAPTERIDSHITEPLPQESEQAEDKREKNEPTPIPQTPAAADSDIEGDKRRAEAERIRLAALNAPADAGPPYFARLQMEATKAKVMKLPLVADGDGNMMALGALIQRAQRTAA